MPKMGVFWRRKAPQSVSLRPPENSKKGFQCFQAPKNAKKGVPVPENAEKGKRSFMKAVAVF